MRVSLDPLCSPWLLRRKQFSLFKKLLAAIVCGLRTKDRSKYVKVSDTATSVQESQEKRGRAQLSACVIIIFINMINGCGNEVDLIL